MTYRPPEHFVHGDMMILPATVCRHLLDSTNLLDVYRLERGQNIGRDNVIRAIIGVANDRSSARGTTDAEPAEPVTPLPWLTTKQAAALAGISTRGIRKAIREDRLNATDIDGQWRINRTDFNTWRAARTPR